MAKWVASWAGIAVSIEGDPSEGPPRFSAQAWLEHSKDSPLKEQEYDRFDDE